MGPCSENSVVVIVDNDDPYQKYQVLKVIKRSTGEVIDLDNPYNFAYAMGGG